MTTSTIIPALRLPDPVSIVIELIPVERKYNYTYIVIMVYGYMQD